jgi:hypothetical protein
MEYAHTKYPVQDGRVRLASVDCTTQDVRRPSRSFGFPTD